MGNPSRTMAESYLPLAEESDRRSAGIVQHFVTMLVGFGLGCAMIYAAGGQPLAVILPANDMAVAQGKFLQASAGANVRPLGQMQAYSPFNAKKYETLSYLPQLTDRQIKSQIDFMIRNKWTPSLEFSDDGDIYLN